MKAVMEATRAEFERNATCAGLALLAVLIGLPMARAADAQNACPGPSEECVATDRWNLSVALGAGVRTNPLASSRNIPLVVIPQFSYYGKRFFIDNLDVGVTLLDGDANMINLIATPGYDRVYFYRSDLQNFFIGYPINGNDNIPRPPMRVNPDTPGAVHVPLSTPRITYLAGPEWTFKHEGASGELDLLHDITGQNNGEEVRAALKMPLPPSGSGALSASVGFTWKSAAIVNYYYGIPNVYGGGAAFDPFVKMGYTRPLAGKWHFTAFAEYERLANAIANSPIVSEHSVATVFVGAIYTR